MLTGLKREKNHQGHAEHHTCQLRGRGFYFCALRRWTSKSACCRLFNLFFPRHHLHCCRFHLGQGWWRHVNSLGLGLLVLCTRTNLQIQLVFLDYHFFLRTKFATLSLLNSPNSPKPPFPPMHTAPVALVSTGFRHIQPTLFSYSTC